MSFALSTKYSVIDFDEVSLAELILIGGGCGESGGGSVTVSSIQAAAQSAAAAPGANSSATYSVNTGTITIGDPVPLNFRYGTRMGITVGDVLIQPSSGHVTASYSGGFWSSVGSFFSWLFGSH